MNKETPILITGATGFIGAHLLQQLLAAGYRRIRILTRPGSPTELVEDLLPRVEVREGDLLDIFSLEQALQGVEVVFHCAAIVSFDPAEEAAMMRANVEGTANLVNTALLLGTPKLIHLSSIAALGRSREGATIDESAKWERSPFNTRYAISKFQGEMEVWRGRAEGLNVAIANPSIVLGSGYWESGPPHFFQLVDQGFRFYPAGTAGLVDVRDVARFLQLLLEEDIQGERFILNADHYPYRRLLTAIAQQLGRRPPSVKVGPVLRRLAWRFAWLQAKLTGKRPFLTRETARNSSLTFYYDNRKSREAFQFSYTPIEKTIRDTAEAYRESQGAKAVRLKIEVPAPQDDAGATERDA